MVKIEGTIPAIVTPFTMGGAEVDLDWMPQHLDFLRRRGADGVLVLGTNGEAPSLSMGEKRAVIDAAAAHRGGLSFVVGTGCAALPETIELSRYALERGADALLIVPPFFFKDLSPRGLGRYYEAVFAALPPEGRVILYNIPAMSGVEIGDELVDALLAAFPDQLLGIKDTSGQIKQTEHYIRRYPGLCIFSGSDSLVGAGYQAGTKGAISAVANACPDLVAGVRQAYLEGGDVAEAQRRLGVVRGMLRRYPQRGAVKHLVHLVAGLAETWVRPPLIDLTPQEKESLRQEAAGLGLVA